MTSPTDPETFYHEGGPPDPMTQSPEGTNSELKSKVLELRMENGQLTESLNRAKDEKEELVSKLNKANQDREDLFRQRKVDQLKIKKLNDMIIKNSSKSDEPLDEEILQDTFKIRNLATEIIKTHFAGEAKFRTEPARRLETTITRISTTSA